MKYSDTHCDFLHHSFRKNQQDLKLFNNSLLAIQSFAIFVSPDCKHAWIDSFRQYLKYKYFTANKKIFDHNLQRVIENVDHGIYPILSIEGLKSSNYSLRLLKFYIANGAKIVSLTWNERNDFASGVISKGELTTLGKKALNIMMDNHTMLDVSHLNRISFYQAIDFFKGKILASHSCCEHICLHDRNLNDDQIKQLIDRDGYIGVNFYPLFLSNSNQKLDVNIIIDHIEHICTLGGQKNVGFGSDFFGIPETLNDVKDCSCLDIIYQALIKRGYSAKQIEGFCFKNFYNFYIQ